MFEDLHERQPVTEDGVIAGNVNAKYGSSNPLIKNLMTSFLESFVTPVDAAGVPIEPLRRTLNTAGGKCFGATSGNVQHRLRNELLRPIDNVFDLLSVPTRAPWVLTLA